MNDSLKNLGGMVATQTERVPDDDRVLQAVRGRLQAKTLRRGQVHLPRMIQAAAALVAVCLLVLFVDHMHGRAKPLSVRLESESSVVVGDWIKAQDETKRLRFSDGTSVSLLPATDILVKEITTDGATVLLGRGRTLAQVEPEEGAQWRFLAGPFAVRVTGTEFDLAWDPGTGVLELALHHGSVVLTGPSLSAPRTVRKGEFVRVEIAGKPAAQTSKTTNNTRPLSDSSAEKSVASDSEGKFETVELPLEVQGPSGQDWRQVLARGDRAAVLHAVLRAGTTNVLATASADELSQLSQIARLGGQPALARDTLLELRERLGQKGQTAYLLGKVYADQLGDVREAVQWFETYLKENPSGTLREQALGRLVHLQAGGAAGKRAARRYLSDYPDGSFAAFARSL